MNFKLFLENEINISHVGSHNNFALNVIINEKCYLIHGIDKAFYLNSINNKRLYKKLIKLIKNQYSNGNFSECPFQK